MMKSSRSGGRLTLFTWGYYGWGNATKELVLAVDAVERARGFQPPVFVDIRIQRSVRAAGFDGPRCGEPVELPAEAVGPNRTDPWNVVGCNACGLTFDFDDAEVQFAEDSPGAL